MRQYIASPAALAFFDMPWVPAYLFVVYMLHAWLGYAGMAAAVTIFVVAALAEFATRSAMQKAHAAQSEAQAMADEARRNSEALHALGMRGNLRERWVTVQTKGLAALTAASSRGGMLSAVSRVIRLLVQSGVLALGAYLAIQGQISAGAIIAASIIMSRALAPVEQAVAGWNGFLAARKSHGRLKALLAQSPPEAERMELPPPKGLLEAENIAVRVAGVEKPLLTGLNFVVAPGTGLGIIGPTGAGKSTLAKVLAGVLPPTVGTVRLDGTAIDLRNADTFGRAIGYLPQDVQLFSGTVAENISRFDANPQTADIVAAAELASVHDMVKRLPDGYDTPLGLGGNRLSAGQKQRLALARALYGNPALVIMDEPNSNLDVDGEAALDRAIRACLARGAAVVVVAHRPSALKAVGHLLVLNEGKQAAFGGRDEVLRQVTRERNGAVAQPAAPDSPPAKPAEKVVDLRPAAPALRS
jgi:PrtD family type I secretion system ABC transporter